MSKLLAYELGRSSPSSRIFERRCTEGRVYTLQGSIQHCFRSLWWCACYQLWFLLRLCQSDIGTQIAQQYESVSELRVVALLRKSPSLQR